MTTRRDRPFVWLTWLARIMAGERACLWASWFRSNHENYAKAPREFGEAAWKIRHTALLAQLAAELEQAGEEVRLEEQNRFRYRRPSGLAVVGVPDLIAITRQGLYDCKTGRPRISDQVQVMLGMHFLPLCRPEYIDTRFEGCVVYRSSRIVIPAAAVDDEFAANVEHFLDLLDSETPARRVPSETECRFCEITKADCSARIEQRMAGASPIPN